MGWGACGAQESKITGCGGGGLASEHHCPRASPPHLLVFPKFTDNTELFILPNGD